MRAIANDIRAGFYVIRASNLISGVPGDTERRLSKIFDTARKNAPCILFIDEIDAVTRTRAQSEHRRDAQADTLRASYTA